MTLYFYNKKYVQLPTWTKIMVGKILERAKDETIKLNIIGYSHHIDYMTKSGQGFTEILASQVPMSVLSDCVEFELTADLKISGDNWELYTTEYQTSQIDDFLRDKNTLFYNFDPKSWTIIKWEIAPSAIYLTTLHTYYESGLTLWSKSFYNI